MIYTAGTDAQIRSDDQVVNPNAIMTGDYVLQYKVPLIAFRLLDPATIQGVITGWVNFRNATAQPGDQVTQVNGVYINTDTGEIDVEVNVSLVPAQMITVNGQTYPATVSEAGVNYLKVVGTIAVLFAALGIVLVLVVVVKRSAGDLGAAVTFGSLGVVIGIGAGIALFVYIATRRNISIGT